VAKLQDDLKTIDTESMKPCIHVSQEWEKVWPRVNEGAFVVKHKDLYYLTYSANSYESQSYGVGFATSKSVEGPWVKYDKNPILQMPEDLVGVGHSAMFIDKEGKMKIVFHAHHSKESIHPRAMYIADVSFTDDAVPVMTISKEIIRPKLK
jgi:beta-xylosidase